MLNRNVLFILVCGLFFWNCAYKTGAVFNHIPALSLKIGEDRINDVLSQIGDKYTIIESNNRHGSYKRITYLYVHDGVTEHYSRLLLLEFKNDILNGYFYSSSNEKDATNFDYTYVDSITINTNSQEDILNWFGKAPGVFRCPTTFSSLSENYANCNETNIWSYHLYGKTKRLEVVFDSAGIVLDFKSENGFME